MKKEVHLRLLKRSLTACLLAVILAMTAVVILEFQRVDQTVISTAVTESRIFSFLFTSYLQNPGETALSELEATSLSAIEQTPYLYMEFLTPEKKLTARISTPAGFNANQLFLNRGIVMIPSGTISGSRIIANKKIYFKISLPVKDKEGVETGYLNGIYQVTRTDTATIISRFILTGAIAIASILGCTLFCYLGFLLFNNQIIRTIGDLNRSNIFLLRNLGAALAKSDVLDLDHNARVLIYSIHLAEKSSLPREQVRALIFGSFLHDLEMLPLDTSLLHKKWKLEQEEYNTIQAHAKNGAAKLKKLKWLNAATPVIHCHHEKYDGSGYPSGIKHEKIPKIARIFAIADAFDAITSTRPYSPAQTIQSALAEMGKNSGIHFDPVLFSSFTQTVPDLYLKLETMNHSELEKEVDRILMRYLKSA